MRKGLATSTLKMYDFAWRTFAFFCFSVHLMPKPVHINSVCAFIWYCMDVRHFKPTYIRGLVAGIQFNARCHNPSFPSLFSNTAIKLLLKGISKVAPPIPDHRQPITLSVLHKMLSALRNGLFSPYTDSLLDAVCLLAFYGFLRIGEFTTCSLTFNPDVDSTFDDLKFHSAHYSLQLKHSKCNGACSIIVARVDSLFCPFRSMIKYLKIRPSTSPRCPLFLIPGKLPLSKTWFNRHLKQILTKSNLSPEHYTAHSFRIGAATSAANQGISSSSLQQMGRWSSSAFTSYIRPDINTILLNQRSLKT